MGPATEPITSVLFVCTGNTCRSVLAEYLARFHKTIGFGSRVKVASAGLRIVPSETAAAAMDCLKNLFGIDASTHVPRAISAVDLTAFEVVVAIDDPGHQQIARALLDHGVQPSLLSRWRVADPYGHIPAEYDQCALSILHSLAELRRQREIRRLD
jgi:protein-tyrosine-phosphatase